MVELIVACQKCGKPINRVVEKHFVEAIGYVKFVGMFDYIRFEHSDSRVYCKDCMNTRMVELGLIKEKQQDKIIECD
jgi:hypothetical protein